MSNGAKTLKKRLFRRDGWYEQDPTTGRKDWYANCSFDCGTILTPVNATVDHYPVPRRLGGKKTLENTRLACQPCNTKDGGPAGAMTKVVPKGLTPLERRQWWQTQSGTLPAVPAGIGLVHSTTAAGTATAAVRQRGMRAAPAARCSPQSRGTALTPSQLGKHSHS